MRAIDLSNYFIEKASEIDENDLTNLKLQKLLYFAQGKYIAKNDRALFEDQIEAWDLGPVIREVYNEYKSCGAFPITTFDIKHKDISIKPETRNFLDEIWNYYGKFSAAHLVKLTHDKGSPWVKNFEKGSNKVIPVEDLKRFFIK